MTKTENKSYLQRIILAYMCKYKLNQKQMAQRLSVSEGTLSAWLNPVRHGITYKHAERIKFICVDVLIKEQQYNNTNATNNLRSETRSDAISRYKSILNYD